MSTRVRLATPGDATAIAGIYRPSVVDRATSFEIEPPDAAEMTRRILVTTERLPWLVYDADGTVLGYAYAGAHRTRAAYQWSVDVSAYVREDAHRRGIGGALYAALLHLLAAQGFCNAYAGIALPNPASEAFHRALGFTPVGVYHQVGYKLGRWHDVLWMERSVAPRRDAPAPPRGLHELRATEMEAALAPAGRFPGATADPFTRD